MDYAIPMLLTLVLIRLVMRKARLTSSRHKKQELRFTRMVYGLTTISVISRTIDVFCGVLVRLYFLLNINEMSLLAASINLARAFGYLVTFILSGLNCLIYVSYDRKLVKAIKSYKGLN